MRARADHASLLAFERSPVGYPPQNPQEIEFPLCLAIQSLRISGANVTELIFLIEDAPEGGYVARALGASIVTEADDLPALREAIRDSVRCHFDGPDVPSVIRLHFVRDEAIAA